MVVEGKRAFGFTGVQVPLVGQGTWHTGARSDRKQEVAALRRGIQLGMTHIDTAELYGRGLAEEMIAEAIAGCGRRRDELFIVSKVLPEHAWYEGTISACEASLRRLRTDYLDVYLLHWRGRAPLEETMRALEELARQGKIRWLGVSNFDVSDLEEAQRALTRQRIACNQVLYHLGERRIEGRVLSWCEKHDVAVVGYSPFGSGSFPLPRSKGGRVLDEVARKHGASPRSVALRFLVRTAPLFTIPKTTTLEHVEDNAKALTLELDDRDLRAIDQAFPVATDDGSLPVL